MNDMIHSEFKKIVAKFRSKNILVIGDIMLDVYVHGDVHRVSPEAPVPIVLQRSEDMALGGAGNVAENVRALGGKVTLMGVIGEDMRGEEVMTLCRAHNIKPILMKDVSRPTSVKMRIVSRGHQLLRIDRESSEKISEKIQKKLAHAIMRLDSYDMVIISDYNKGVFTPSVIEVLVKKFKREIIVADIKPEQESLYRGMRVVKPNMKESFEMTGIYADSEKNATKALHALSKQFRSSIILTRGEHGMSVYDTASSMVSHIPSRARHVFDVTGAGDAVIASFALMYSCGIGMHESARIANVVGGMVVEKKGTATVSNEELVEYLEHYEER